MLTPCLAEQIGENATDDAVREDRVWRDEETEEPGTFFPDGGRASDLLQGDFGHGFDVSTTVAVRSPS